MAAWGFPGMGVSMTDPSTVISKFVVDLTGSTVWVGGLATILTALGEKQILANAAYPNNQASLFGISAVGLAITSLGF